MTASSGHHLRHLATLATKATDRALALDERGKRREAIDNYERASQILRRLLNFRLRFHVTTDKSLILKMERYLSMVEQRLGSLRRVIKGEYYVKDGSRKGEWESEMERRIEMDILDHSPGVRWEDVSGLEGVKKALQEMVVLPARRPDLYQGLRAPSRGMLLYGPSGTGKSLIAKAVATESNATFFSISASSLASKYHGESEQLMRALFEVARRRQPSFIFIDEIDSILGKRGGDEHEASRRLKTEFLCMFDGATTSGDERIFICGASNRPYDLDEAVRRRLVRRFYVPLPDSATRFDMMRKLRDKPGIRWNVSDEELKEVAEGLKWFSGSDINALCREAALMPLRDLGEDVDSVSSTNVRPVDVEDLLCAKDLIRPNISKEQLLELESWTKKFGTRTGSSTTSGRPPRSSSLPPNRRRRRSPDFRKDAVARDGRQHTRTRSADTEYSPRRSRRSSSSSSLSSKAGKPPLPVPESGRLRRQLSGITERRSGRHMPVEPGHPWSTRRRFFD